MQWLLGNDYNSGMPGPAWHRRRLRVKKCFTTKKNHYHRGHRGTRGKPITTKETKVHEGRRSDIYLRPRKRMREVKARPSQALKVGTGCVGSMTLLTTKGLQRPVMLSKPPRTAR